MIRVLVVDDHQIVRDGLRRILSAQADLEVADEAGDGDAALALVRSRDYDVAVLDMSMPGLSGIDLIRRIRAEKPALRLLVLSMHGERQYAARAMKAGASGYLNKDSAAEQLVGALRKIAAGGVHLSDAGAASLVDAQRGSGSSLTDRELEVVRLLSEGLGPTEIGERLHLSVKTVSTHKARAQEKLGVQGTAELIRYAIENKLL
jgi:DNA-binding NarL/FixJ family response regulator